MLASQMPDELSKLTGKKLGAAAAAGLAPIKLLTPWVAVTLSQNLSLPLARKAMPPEVIAVVEALTCESKVVPLLSKSLPVMLPELLQLTSSRYQWSGRKFWLTDRKSTRLNSS